MDATRNLCELQLGVHAGRGLWALVASMHVGYAIAYGFEARYYFDSVTSSLYISFLLRVFGRKQHLRDEVSYAVLVSSVLVCAWHLNAFFRMARVSLTHRKLLFRRLPVSMSKLQPPQLHRSSLHTLASLVCFPWRWLSRMWSIYGGVDGKYYELFTDLRESFEIATQTYAVYRLSYFVSKQGINSLATLALVASCWSTPILRTWFANSARGPLIRTAVGVVLASIFTVVVPFLVFASYYQLALAPVYTRYDSSNFINRGNLFQQVFVLTWKDWISTRLAAVFAIASLETIKRKGNESVMQKRPQPSLSSRTISVLPEAPAPIRLVKVASTDSAAIPDGRPISHGLEHAASSRVFHRVANVLDAASSRAFHRVANTIFFLMGLTGLALHIHASSHPSPISTSAGVQCSLVTRPWMSSSSVCAVMSLNCFRLGIDGNHDDWEAVLDLSARSETLKRLIGIQISHCSHLEFPKHVQHMENLIQIVVFNSSIDAWGEDAALTSRRHPQLTVVSLLTVRNLHKLPPGLLANDFPAVVFEVTDSDLAELPANLAQLWPEQLEQINIERSQLTSVPTALLEMHIGRLSLAGNQIRDIPSAFFSNHNYYRSLLLSANPLQALPSENVENFNAHELGLVGTNISTLPMWVDDAAARSVTREPFVLAADTPLCLKASNLRPEYVQCTPPELATLTFYIEIDKIALANPP